MAGIKGRESFVFDRESVQWVIPRLLLTCIAPGILRVHSPLYNYWAGFTPTLPTNYKKSWGRLPRQQH